MIRMRGRAPGFTLIELLITVAILAIVTTLATGGYREYLRRANRVDATSALLRLASAQEKFFAQNGQYADSDAMGGAPPAGLGMAASERGYYLLDMQLPGGGVPGFLALATVNDASNQADDDDCWVLTIDERGLRGAETRDGDTGAAVAARCWR